MALMLTKRNLLTHVGHLNNDCMYCIALTVCKKLHVQIAHGQLQVLHRVVGVKGRGKNQSHLLAGQMYGTVEKEAELSTHRQRVRIQ